MRATAIELEPLPRRGERASSSTRSLADARAAGRRPRATLLEKTEGNPLFVEETIRMLARAAAPRVERIPDTLQALIAARIDRLPPAEKRAAPARAR